MQSHYIEVAQGGVSSRAESKTQLIVNIYIVYFEPKKIQTKFSYKREIMQLFSTDATIFKKEFELFFTHENIERPSSKLAYFTDQLFFSLLPTVPKSAQMSYSVP